MAVVLAFIVVQRPYYPRNLQGEAIFASYGPHGKLLGIYHPDPTIIPYNNHLRLNGDRPFCFGSSGDSSEHGSLSNSSLGDSLGKDGYDIITYPGRNGEEKRYRQKDYTIAIDPFHLPSLLGNRNNKYKIS
ncbi:MAG: hypothetical protein A2Z19_00215 [Deltaproteobacteria bacterium RBG_16_54_18]|nr:MAG: hypothetical protein A2Z19_00215 [Deltaproteobacteria bacterium RBG_16_54_18]